MYKDKNGCSPRSDRVLGQSGARVREGYVLLDNVWCGGGAV